jgi:hypothetical protein
MWACLDSNQGPLPYQRSKSISNASCLIRELGSFKTISAFLAPEISGSVQLRSCPVAAHPDVFRGRDKTLLVPLRAAQRLSDLPDCELALC